MGDGGDGADAVRMAGLMRRHGDLAAKKIAADTELAVAEREERRLRDEAKEKYGTSDLDELRAMHEERIGANRRALDAFEGEIGAIESGLASIERSDGRG